MLERDNYSFSILKKGPKIESSFTQQEELVHNKTMRKKNNKNKKRFSDEQIKSLESIFESETKLDPRMKVEVAKELELQPRQVAIWFQNRRARWKSKQLERDYTILKSNYDDLASKYESVQKEKQALMKQLEKLRDLMGKTREESSSCGLGLVGSITDGDSDNGDNKSESEKKLGGGGGRLVEGGELDFRLNPYSDDEYSNKNLDYLGQDDEEEIDLMNISAPTYGILASPNEWCSFDDDSTGRLFDPNQSCSNSSQWWEFWPTIPSNDNFEANGGQN